MKSMHRVKILRNFFFLPSTGQYLDFCTGTAFQVQSHLQPTRLLYIYTFFSILSTHIAWVSLEKGQLHQDSEACTIAGSRYMAFPPAQIPLILVAHHISCRCWRLALTEASPAIDLDDSIHDYALELFTLFPFRLWRTWMPGWIGLVPLK